VIASLTGRLESLGKDSAVVNVGGIGFQVFLPTGTLESLGHAGATVSLHTHLQVREDALTLYGFATGEELSLFQTLTGVSGIGPKLGLAMLSAMSVPRLASAIVAEDTVMLSTIPGIGKKLASRIVLELKDKLTPMASLPVASDTADGDVMAALTSLGYSAAEAARAVANLPQDSTLSLEDRVRAALGYFGHG